MENSNFEMLTLSIRGNKNESSDSSAVIKKNYLVKGLLSPRAFGILEPPNVILFSLSRICRYFFYIS